MICSFVSAKSLKKVTVELKWFHQFQFAGVYAAKEKGFYQKEGLDVTIMQRNPASSPVKDVLSGKVQFGVSDSTLVRERLLGKPVVLLAAIFQHSPLVLISLEKEGIVSPLEVAGKRIMYQKNVDDAIILGMFNEFNITEKDYVFIPHNFNDLALLDDSNKVDLMSAYLSNQPFLYQERGIKINIMKPQNYGVDFYGDMIFTSQDFFKNNKKIAVAFRRATIAGWKYALTHPEEVFNWLKTTYKTKKSLAALKYEATVTERMIVPEHIDIGYISEKRLKNIAELYVKRNIELKGATIDGLLYTDHQLDKSDFQQIFVVIIIVIISLLVILLVLFAFNRRLAINVKDRTKEIEKLSKTDMLTGLANRYYLTDILERQIERCKRYGESLVLMMIDIDNFKSVNDSHGHVQGDTVLREVTSILNASSRTVDVACRWGGDELVLVCPATDLQYALVIAERIRQAVATKYQSGYQITASLGLAQWCTGDDINSLFEKADKALYVAKSKGKNRSESFSSLQEEDVK